MPKAITEENPEENTQDDTTEFYHKDIFGTVVDVSFAEDEEITDAVKSAGAGRGDFSAIFAFTDAIGDRKKKDAWVLYRKALASGQVAEQLFYKAVWVVKTMLIAQRTESYKETDMKEYPYKKAKGFLRNWKQGEIEKLSEDLVVGYHKVRRGEGDMETMLEKLILRL
jgi:hypothetical protein